MSSVPRLFGVYSDPRRDHRRHTVSAVFIASVKSLEGLRAGDDAKAVEVVPIAAALALDFAFDHRVIVADYLAAKQRSLKNKDVDADVAPGWSRSTCSNS